MPRFLTVTPHDNAAGRLVHGALIGPVSKRLVVTALAGVQSDGALADGFAAQAARAFDNLAGLLATAGLRPETIILVRAFVTGAGDEDLAAIRSLAKAHLPGTRPSVAVRHVERLTIPGCLIELDAEAVAED